ncbi:hypothetical protein HPP92_015021 [Vanilla planifolia]|uniref:Uncharacterized protein n=1 Tax=Vanilla planifolia TaxID=51239 RepID=A0A835QIE7_VANPL|nr:hypothetical protein HPP92_015021 [Vanilla planifolia]
MALRRVKGEQWTELLSWEPRAFVYHNFLLIPEQKIWAYVDLIVVYGMLYYLLLSHD